MKKITILVFICIIGISGYILYRTQYAQRSILTLSTQTIDTDYYTIKIVAPLDPAQTLPQVHDAVTRATSEFEKTFNNLSTEDIKTLGLGGDRKYTLDISTKIATSSKTTSYILTLYEDTGGAHGITSVQAFTYDKKGTYITSDTLFSDPQWEKQISTLTRTSLAHTLYNDDTKADALVIGTEVGKHNFDQWYISGDSLIFIFGDYQVGPYVFGIQEVPIKKEVLHNILNNHVI